MDEHALLQEYKTKDGRRISAVWWNDLAQVQVQEAPGSTYYTSPLVFRTAYAANNYIRSLTEAKL
jgi:hypothetical protein